MTQSAQMNFNFKSIVYSEIMQETTVQSEKIIVRWEGGHSYDKLSEYKKI